MIRALVKAALMWPVGNLPRGPSTYHAITCGVLGSQRFHPPKLTHAWKRYASLLHDPCGLPLEGLDTWVHDGGWTPISAFTSFLVTGRAAVLTNRRARVLGRYLALSLREALQMELSEARLDPELVRERRRTLRRAARLGRVEDVVAALGGHIQSGSDPTSIQLCSSSIDFCHSGNALEHYPVEILRRFLGESFRILRPGGVTSHVFDHRDHLHHVDRSWPFLFHRLLPERAYDVAFGHPLLYHNRLGPKEVVGLFEEAGFERIVVRRAGVDFCYRTDEEVLQQPPGLPHWARGRLPGFSELDLRTAYAHYLFRKPSQPTVHA